MKRRREEMGKGKSELRLAMEGLSFFSSGDGKEDQEQVQEQPRSSTMDLLCVSKQLIHVLDEIGPTLLVLRQDIQQNVQRLEELHAKDPSKYVSLTAIVTEEVEEGTSKKTNSCTRAIIWLARSINFSKYLLERLVKTPDSSLEEVVEEAYRCTLKPWHGWISSAAYKVALKLVPEKEIFIALLIGNCQEFEDLAEDVKILTDTVKPLLEEIDAILAKHNLDKLKCS
ncbi:glycolipid transfer protein 2-like [Phragmites australis]|uniref:glycolipid transfer protein 2-like n=1 Tax=Phragmites australis TaxID=29695 RepID=UPI002D792FED|nr:glycolipid transfer protein 2-like [Phragmites australis]